MKRAVGYVRVSTKRDDQATSPAIQRAMIEQECERQGWKLLRMFEDRFSGENLDRPDFRELTTYLDEHQVDLLIVKDLSRFGRETLDYLSFTRRYLEPRGIELYVLQGVNGKERGIELIRLLDMWIAEDFRITNKRKITAAVEMCASKGYWTGGIPYGYYSSKRETGRGPCILKPDPELAPIARQIFAWSAEGLRARAIVHRLNLQGIPGPKGEEWGKSTVERLLRSKVYIGMINYRGQNLPGAHEALIDEATWHKAQSSREPGRITRTPGRYLLSRMYCPLYIRTNGTPLPFYGITIRGIRHYMLAHRDDGREAPATPIRPGLHFPRAIRADVVETAVLDCFKTADEVETLPLWWLELQQQGDKQLEHEAGELAALRKELRRLGQERVKTKQRFHRALDYALEADARELSGRMVQIEQQIEAVELQATRLAELIEPQQAPQAMPQPLVQQINVLSLLQQQDDRVGLREALRLLINRILITVDDAGEPTLEIELRSQCFGKSRRL